LITNEIAEREKNTSMRVIMEEPSPPVTSTKKKDENEKEEERNLNNKNKHCAL
jgi:hypothetical protein